MISQNELTALSEEDRIIIHVGRSEGYINGHIPGAVFMGNSDYVSVSEDSLYTELPELNDFKSALLARGINPDSYIILCSDWQSFAQAFRLYFTFEYFGFNKNVRILDGGIKGWGANGLEVSTDTVVAKTSKSDLNLSQNNDLLVDKNWIRDHLQDKTVSIVDARTPEYYTGEKDGEGYYKRSGHIQGAKNITWKTLVDENHFLISKKEIKKKLSEQGIKSGQNVVSYCHVGLRASVLYTVGKGLGYSTVLYDGSYNEWDRLGDDYPFEYGGN